MLHVKHDTIYDWEEDRYHPNTRKMPSIISFLGYNPLPTTTLAEKVKAHRLSLGLSQLEYAKSLDLHSITIFKVEHGGRVMEKTRRKLESTIS